MEQKITDDNGKLLIEPDDYAFVETTNALRATTFFEDVYGIKNPRVELHEKTSQNTKIYKCRLKDTVYV